MVNLIIIVEINSDFLLVRGDGIVTEERIQSFIDYLTYVKTQCTKDYLFRGINNSNFRLIPKIGRESYVQQFRGTPDEILNKLQDLEEQIMRQFIRMSVPYMDLRHISAWDQWTIGQHYGLPTRFLDWTENPLIAAYFAVEGAKTDAAVYIINRAQFNTSNDVEDPFSSDDEILLHIPSYINARIIAQKGIFTVHKNPMLPVDETSISGTPCTVTKLIIEQNCHNEFLNSLDWCGINRSFIYPGLDGLASYLDFQAKN